MMDFHLEIPDNKNITQNQTSKRQYFPVIVTICPLGLEEDQNYYKVLMI